MKKKNMYFTIDNGDTPITADINGIIDMLKCEMEDADLHHEDVELYEWRIFAVLMTKEKFENLPEAY